MSLKTTQMLKIFQPIEEQIKKLSCLMNETKNDATEMVTLRKLIIDQLHNLAEKLENASKEGCDTYGEMKKKVTSIIEEFCTMDFNKNVENEKNFLDESLFQVILEKFLKILENLEKTETAPLKQNLQECLEYIKEMSGICEIEDLQNIKELGLSITELLRPLQYYRKNLNSKLLSERLLLYCCQLCASFKMLVQVIKEQHRLKAPIYSCKKYICERTCYCFEAIIDIIDAPNASEEEEYFEEENNFVHRIDLALDVIANLPKKSQEQKVQECEDLWFNIEEIFAHAMSIAQVCQPYNFKAISGSLQSILTEFDNLKNQLKAVVPDLTMNNFFMNTLTDAIYRLERKINIAVLTLVMEVFSDIVGPLKKLVNLCGIAINVNNRTKNDLDSAIEEFDQWTDKCVQIGKFAISCCRDKNRVQKIKNCLASFESLETEVIPSITSFYLHPNNIEMRQSVKLLTTEWQSVTNEFQHTVNLIIDPAVFCEIVYDDLQERVHKMTENLDKKQNITSTEVGVIIQRATSLSRQIIATIEDIGPQTIDKHANMTIREFKAAIYEVDAASKKFLGNEATSAEQLRVINRCEIMLKVIKRLFPVLSNIVKNSVALLASSMHTICSYKSMKGQGDSICRSTMNFPSSIHQLPFDQKSSVYIPTPYSVKNCKQPLTIQPADAVPRNESDVSVLLPYIKKGQAMRNEWSLMYKTPRTPFTDCKSDNVIKNRLKTKNLASIRQHLFSRDTFLEETELNSSNESLDLTNILENISRLSDTLSSEIKKSSPNTFERSQFIPSSMKRVKNFNKSCLDKVTRRLSECSVTGGGDAPMSVGNLDRSKYFRKKFP
ncbi:uncharacterized protein LOC106651506 [Trichogramma pretiosum]|uniref:uncharacterized protein LOC106651506 n=1 Tax=Trichogramma pretiosum TaxID=7493 RepID=UPI0006C9BAF8|nr:uncharacterized protein LOC106651506 [Trichogramma pretiosum]